GFGRFYTLEEAGIQLICCADGGDGSPGGTRVGPVSETLNVESVGNGDSYYGNFPPLDSTVNLDPGNPSSRATWPQWLKDLYDTNQDLALKALNPKHWNWMLAKAVPHEHTTYNRQGLPPSETLKLGADEKIVQAVFLMELFCPSAGWTAIQPD